MSIFTLAISCLTTCSLPWFMDLTFQVPMQYCSWQNQTLFPSPVTSTDGHCFALALLPHFFWRYFSTGFQYWAPIVLGSSSLSVILFCLFILFMFMGFSRQEYWGGLPFPSPVDHILSELSAMTHPSWEALHGMAHSFTELDKAVVLFLHHLK